VDADRLLDGLDPSQRRAVTTDAQPLAILAGAGSGKTRVLTRRIAHRCATGTADPRHVLALTFTRKAAAELDGRLRAFGLRDLPAAGTFHAVAYAQLRTRWASIGAAAPTLLDTKARTLRQVLGNTRVFQVPDLAAEIEWAQARMVRPDQYALRARQADRRLRVDPDRIAEWYRRYVELKRQKGLVDFDDLLHECAVALEDDPSFGAAQRWRFRHLFVDEFQDLNPLQARLLRAWLGDRPDLCVVGDPNQAIYGWNGAKAEYLTEFRDYFPGGEVVELAHSYRCTPEILATADAILGRSTHREGPITSVRASGAAPTIVGYESDLDEAAGIARALHDHHAPGRPWSAQAVLVRTNGQLPLLESTLRRAAIPHTVRGANRFMDEPVVADLVAAFANLREPLSTALGDLQAATDRERLELEEARADAIDPDDPWTWDRRSSAQERRLGLRDQFVSVACDFLVVEPAAMAADLPGWLRSNLLDNEDESKNAVTLLTFHAAKGLEWSVVHLAGMEQGFVPIGRAKTPEAIDEELRLAYVAVTRGVDVVRLTWARQRAFGETVHTRRPSEYLDRVRPVLTTMSEEPIGIAAPRSAVAATRAELDRAELGERPLHDAHVVRSAIQAWRAEVARRASVRPTVVLSDKAVEALVRARPSTLDALAAVPDVGPSTREQHGARLLAVIAGT
jgi:DNA helicase-2/ATP-dependent DNA helicase PcrA